MLVLRWCTAADYHADTWQARKQVKVQHLFVKISNINKVSFKILSLCLNFQQSDKGIIQQTCNVNVLYIYGPEQLRSQRHLSKYSVCVMDEGIQAGESSQSAQAETFTWLSHLWSCISPAPPTGTLPADTASPSSRSPPTILWDEPWQLYLRMRLPHKRHCGPHASSPL